MQIQESFNIMTVDWPPAAPTKVPVYRSKPAQLTEVTDPAEGEQRTLYLELTLSQLITPGPRDEGFDSLQHECLYRFSFNCASWRSCQYRRTPLMNALSSCQRVRSGCRR